jgi:hypothetical protein
MKNKKMITLLILMNTFFIQSAFADVVWPALFFESHIMSWWAILLGLFIEYFFNIRDGACNYVITILINIRDGACNYVITILKIMDLNYAYLQAPSPVRFKDP